MNRTNETRLPGDTLETLIQEFEYLEEFKRYLRERFDLERDHLAALQKQRESFNSKIKESTVWTLVSPIFEYFDTEIQQRKDTYDSFIAQLNELSAPVSPNEPDEDGVAPLTIYKELSQVYETYEKCSEVARSPEAVAHLQEWYGLYREPKYIHRMTTEEIIRYQIPEPDRGYRESVLNQRRTVERQSQWHNVVLPTRLEAHQQQAEDIKKLMDDIMNQQSDLASGLVRSCSTAVLAISKFSSVLFVGKAQEGQEQEQSHRYFNRAEYINYAFNKRPCMPIFGTELALELPKRLLQLPKADFLFSGYAPKISDMFTFEEKWNDAKVSDPVQTIELDELRSYVVFSFLSAPCLLPLTDDVIRRHNDGISRNKLNTLLALVSPPKKILFLKALLYMYHHQDVWYIAPTLLTHRNDTTKILLDIWRKWDVENDRPFPGNIEREPEFGEAPARSPKRRNTTHPLPPVTPVSPVGNNGEGMW